MEGHLIQRGKRKTWYLVYDLPKKHGEKRRQKSVRIGCIPKNQALARTREILQKIDKGTWVEERPDVRVRDFLESWLEDIRDDLAATTHARYTGLVRSYFVPVIGDVMLRKVTKEHVKNIDRLLRGKHLSSQTRLHAHRALHTAFEWAVKEHDDLLEENVVSKVAAPRVEPRKVSPMSHDRVRAILEAAKGTRLEAPVLLASLTGLRRGELLALRWANISLDKGSLYVIEALEHTRAYGVRVKKPKSAKSHRSVPLATECIELLRRHKVEQDEARSVATQCYTDNDLVFPNPDGALWPPDSFSVQFGKLATAAGCKGFRLHDLRHGFASLMLADGVSLKEVSGLLGHSSESLTLSTYAHLVEGYGRAAVNSLARSLLGSEVAGAA